MKDYTPRFFIGAAWEILRFFILSRLLSRYIELNELSTLILLWLGASQLVMSAGFLMIGVFPERYAGVIRFLMLGKVLVLLPGIGVCIIQAFTVLFVQIEDAIFRLSLFLPSFMIFCMDLTFFLFLLSYSKKLNVQQSHDDEARQFPDDSGKLTEEE